MNKHIELIKKWLANPDSVTKKELLANEDAAYDAEGATDADYLAYNAAYYASYYAVKASKTTNQTRDGYVKGAGYWIRQYEELTKRLMKKPIKSNGGSSAYYTLVINDQTVETEDVIRDVFANDFDFGNAFKSLVRAYGALNGAGKDGNTVDYEMNKLRYSSKKIERQNG